MIVVDASAILEVLLQTSVAERVMDRLFGRPESLHAPHLVDVEVLQVLRRYVADRVLGPTRAEEALAAFRAMPVERYSHELLLERMWQLRQNITAYDAAYVALAELLDAPLLTRDIRLARSTGHRAEIELV